MSGRSGCRNRNGPESGAANIDRSIESTPPAYQKQQLHLKGLPSGIKRAFERLDQSRRQKRAAQKIYRVVWEGCKLIDLC